MIFAPLTNTDWKIYLFLYVPVMGGLLLWGTLK